MTYVQPLGFRVPKPASRSDQVKSFGDLRLSAPGEIARPATSVDPAAIRDLPYGLIRVLDDKGEAVGPWNPGLAPSALRRGLEMMLLTRAFDDRMFRSQRQGKTTFYIKSTGEEAIGCAQAMALQPNDMCFTSYRQQGILLSRGYPVVDLINQIYNNSSDPLKGRQLPILYSSRKFGYYSMSGMWARASPTQSGGRWPRPTAIRTTWPRPGSATARPRRATFTTP